MSILMIFFYIVLGLVGLVLLLALIAKRGYAVERSIVIDKPAAQVFEYVKHIRNQDNYNKWVMRDPNMQKSYKGMDGTVGFAYAWDGNKLAGKGEQTITRIVDGEEVHMQIVFIRPFAGVSDSVITTIPDGPNATAVKWSFKSKMSYPMNAMLLFMSMDTVLGPDLETSLNNLKTILEQTN